MYQACSIKQVLFKSHSFHMVKSWKFGLGKRERERKKKKKTDLLLETVYAGKRRQTKQKQKTPFNNPKFGNFDHFCYSELTPHFTSSTGPWGLSLHGPPAVAASLAVTGQALQTPWSPQTSLSISRNLGECHYGYHVLTRKVGVPLWVFSLSIT